ncbi:MAG: hypothetical protein QMC90_01660 [Dehalococcoidales bacterium]|nr:hypothetical protein [Dehalococcoidales bacterium]
MSSRSEDQFISYYDLKIKEMQNITYGGSLRALKGSLVESLRENMVKQAWKDVGGNQERLSIGRRMYYFRDKRKNKYGLSQDRQVFIDEQLRLSIECKAYAELAMYKRIIVDCHILQSRFPDLSFCLFQLESMLGGDYAENPAHPKGSPGVHVINSFFPHIKLEIITLLDGERRIDQPIHQLQVL